MAAQDLSSQDALFEFLLRQGDNALVLGHRLSEWCGMGPVLEEDIALANTALDLIGQTRLWLSLAGEVDGSGRGDFQIIWKPRVFDDMAAAFGGDHGENIAGQRIRVTGELSSMFGTPQLNVTSAAQIEIVE